MQKVMIMNVITAVVAMGINVLLIVLLSFDAQASTRELMPQIQRSFENVASVCWRGAFSAIDITLVPGKGHADVTHARHSDLAFVKPGILSEIYPSGDVLSIAACEKVPFHEVRLSTDIAPHFNELALAEVYVQNPDGLAFSEPWWVSGSNVVIFERVCGADQRPPTLLMSGRAHVTIEKLQVTSLTVCLSNEATLHILESAGTPRISGEVRGGAQLILPGDCSDDLERLSHLHHMYFPPSDEEDRRV